MRNDTSWPSVSIVIPNYNGADLIEGCLKDFLSTDYPNFEIIIVDDASTDESVKIINQFRGDPRLRVIVNPMNLGSAGARDVGIKEAKNEIIVFLDNDTRLKDVGWLKKLVRVFKEDHKIGAAQSKMLLLNGKISCAGERIIPYIGWIILLGYNKRPESYNRIIDICASSGAMAVRRRLANMLLFDPKFLFNQFEDLDFNWRIWLSGHKVVLAPNSEVYHDFIIKKRHFTLNRHKIIQYASQRNCIRMLLKNWGRRNLVKYLPTSLVAMIFRALFSLAKRKDPYPIIGLIKGIIWNILNFHNTLIERYKVQCIVRRVSDDFLMNHVMIWLPPLHLYRKYLLRGRGF